ncbi:type VI secretion system baseplate subunit TssF [Pseudorhodoferax sp. Leaf267]|uniref:type VI secretion system baseplate subunit TssF n=1 Tax=Pseudorhodoferax sp. Leaf267 TaxID=1736316 RepID=UPI0007014213|nr:type VI secretion system baseplate subunit TssF [Pseudorhodoferax sp. Leaf267]KQP22431.1 type VI secretion system protein ImpG [Pseudorhodoferax sp. Leaf267]
MDPRLLRLYSDELTHLREVGGEFAHAFPKIASRLSMEGMEVTDPYVERLMEGFAFMAAHVQLKIEAEQPRLIAQLLEASYPNFLAPVPSMMVARFDVDVLDPNLTRGHVVPRGSAITSELARGQDTHCEFRTAHAVTLWPIELVAVQYFTHAPDLPLGRLPQAQGTQGGLRIRLRTGGGLGFHQLGLDRLAFYLSAPDEVALRLHELLHGACTGTLVSTGPGGALPAWRGPGSLQPLGFAADEALLPESLRAFSGYRLLQEAAAMPQRLLFFEIGDLATRLAQVSGDEVELIVLLRRGDAPLEALVDRNSLALHCTPAINLFRKRLDRIQLGAGAWEYHVVPDRTRPMDFEVHSLETVTGYGNGAVGQQRFEPLYATQQGASSADAAPAHGFYTVRREPRLRSQRQMTQGARSSYIGEEVYLALVDPRHAPYREDIRQLSVAAWVSNRDLPMLLPHGADLQQTPVWRLDAAGPVRRVDALRGPTRPVTRRPVGELGWQLVSHLSLNHLSLVSASPADAAAALRTTLLLYAPPEDAAWARQVAGVQSLQVNPIVRRLPFKGPMSFGSGIEIVLELDELAYQGTSAFLFASVLERFFARHAAINAFTQLVLRTPQRGELMRWAPRIGLRETV